MKAEVTFREGEPAPGMTRDETVTWLLGYTESTGAIAALAVLLLVTSTVDGLEENNPLKIETPQGRYLLTVTVSRRRLRRVRTYHAQEI